MKFSRSLQTTRLQEMDNFKVNIEDEPPTDFKTIFQVSFALENQVVHDRHYWLVQNFEEARTQKRRLDVPEKSNRNQPSRSSGGHLLLRIKLTFVFILDLCSFMGITWFVLTRIVFGPLSSLLVKERYIADLEHRVIYDI